MSVLNVTKSLITMEDLAQGAGRVAQIRNGAHYILGRVDIPYSVDNEDQLKELDTTKFESARVYTTPKLYKECYYDPTDSTGIVPNVGTGSWVQRFNSVAFDFTGVSQAIEDADSKATAALNLATSSSTTVNALNSQVTTINSSLVTLTSSVAAASSASAGAVSSANAALSLATTTSDTVDTLSGVMSTFSTSLVAITSETASALSAAGSALTLANTTSDEVDILAGTVTTLSSSVATLTTETETANSNADAALTLANASSDEVDTLAGTVTALSSSVATLTTETETANSNADAALTLATSSSDLFNTLDDAVTALSSSVATLASTANTANTNAASALTLATTASTDITDLKAEASLVASTTVDGRTKVAGMKATSTAETTGIDFVGTTIRWLRADNSVAVEYDTETDEFTFDGTIYAKNIEGDVVDVDMATFRTDSAISTSYSTLFEFTIPSAEFDRTLTFLNPMKPSGDDIEYKLQIDSVDQVLYVKYISFDVVNFYSQQVTVDTYFMPKRLVIAAGAARTVTMLVKSVSSSTMSTDLYGGQAVPSGFELSGINLALSKKGLGFVV